MVRSGSDPGCWQDTSTLFLLSHRFLLLATKATIYVTDVRASHSHGQHVPLQPLNLLKPCSLHICNNAVQHDVSCEVSKFKRKHQNGPLPKFSEVRYAFLNTSLIDLLQLPQERQKERRIPLMMTL